MNKHEQLLTNELMIKRRAIMNKVFLGIFLFIAISALIMKLVDGVLLDLGWHYNGKDGIHPAFWMKPENLKTGLISGTAGAADAIYGPLDKLNPDYHSNWSMVSHHPSTAWLLTQFTWITTLIVIVLIAFRFFKYDETTPRWLRWIMTQRTLSLITMYDTIVSVVFWAGMFKSFDKAFNGSLRGLELTITVIVHAIIPLFMVIYSITYLINDKKASVLKEMFVIKGMIYPTIYIAYYILIAVVWSDPYAVTHIHDNITSGFKWGAQAWLAAGALVGIWTLLGIMILVHNIVLLKFNKKYVPERDYEIGKRKQYKIDKIKRRIIRKHARELLNKK